MEILRLLPVLLMDYCLKHLMDTLEVIYQVLILLLGKILKLLISQELLEIPITLQEPQLVFVQVVVAMTHTLTGLQGILFPKSRVPIPFKAKVMTLGGYLLVRQTKKLVISLHSYRQTLQCLAQHQGML